MNFDSYYVLVKCTPIIFVFNIFTVWKVLLSTLHCGIEYLCAVVFKCSKSFRYAYCPENAYHTFLILFLFFFICHSLDIQFLSFFPQLRLLDYMSILLLCVFYTGLFRSVFCVYSIRAPSERLVL